MNYTADFLIRQLDLAAHPEGGYYRENYRCDEVSRGRNLATSIYFLLSEKQKSRFHVLKSDEIWYHHAGSAVNIHMIHPDGGYEVKKLGPDLSANEEFHVLIRKETAFAADLADKKSFSLVSCVVSPGFTFEDFKLFTYEELAARFPGHENLFREFT